MTDSVISRRAVLIAAGAASAAGALAACGGSGSSGTSSATGSSPTGSPTPGPTSASPSGQPLGPAADVPVGGGLVYKDQGIVVTQVAAGSFAAFTAQCPHQGCLVSEVIDNQIVCPCHMSLFSATTGAVEQGPATKGLAPIPVADVDGTLIVS